MVPHTRGSWRVVRVLLLGACANLLAASLVAQTHYSYLENIADQARRNGKTSVEVPDVNPEGSMNSDPASLAKYLREQSLVLGTVVRAAATTSHNGGTIFTWHVVAARRLSGAPVGRADEFLCTQWIPVPASLTLAPGQMGLPFVGGTVQIDGVSIVLKSKYYSQLSLRTGEQYLLIGPTCGDRAIFMDADGGSIYQVMPNGTLVRPPSLASNQLTAYVMSFGTLDQLVASVTSR